MRQKPFVLHPEDGIPQNHARYRVIDGLPALPAVLRVNLDAAEEGGLDRFDAKALGLDPRHKRLAERIVRRRKCSGAPEHQGDKCYCKPDHDFS